MGRGQFLNFQVRFNDFISQKVFFFSGFIRVCVGLIMLAACT
jgi:hypothetical protein